ncbi:MAG: hypothetical protein CMA25_07485 [Euryarchaeota archaeon]|nr:hypothetical protein [Euryarchaeota archaeon]
MRKATIVLVLLFCTSSLNTFQASDVNHEFSEDEFVCSKQNVSEGASVDCEITNLNFTQVNQIRYRLVADGFNQEVKSVPGKGLISNGNIHTCAILDNASTMCWGSDGDGRLGDGGEDNAVSKPTSFVTNPEGESFKSIHAGHENTCGITDSGKLYCWGNNNNGKNGIGSTNTEKLPSTPVTFNQNTTIEKLSMGLYHSCAIDSDNTVWCWGRAWNGNLGSGDGNADQYAPVQVELPGENDFATEIAAGERFTCALLGNGAISCWGHDGNNQLGDSADTTGDQNTPQSYVSLPSGRIAVDIDAGQNHACAVLDNGSIVCWGYNNYGKLGSSFSSLANSLPVYINTTQNKSFTQVSTGYDHTCALLENGTGMCWGRNTHGQLGNDSTTNSFYPVYINQSQTGPLIAISAKNIHTCAINASGGAFCWGSAHSGALGNSVNNHRWQAYELAPTPVTWSGMAWSNTIGPVADKEWNAGSWLKGYMENDGTNTFNISIDIPPGSIHGNYSVEIYMLMKDGQRNNATFQNVFKVLEKDTDGDNVVDSEDAFPDDSTQWSDTDDDGYGDNPNGTNPDAYPDDPERWELIETALGSEAESRISNQTIYIGVGLMLVLTFFLFRLGPKKAKKKVYTSSTDVFGIDGIAQGADLTEVSEQVDAVVNQLENLKDTINELEVKDDPLEDDYRSRDKF